MIHNGFTIKVLFEPFSVCYSNNNNGKFTKDTICYEDDSYIIILDGIILNRKDLLSGTNLAWEKLVVERLSKEGVGFVNLMNGSFYGALVDKNNKKCIAFTDKLGTKFLYSYQDSNMLIISSMMSQMYEALRENSIHYTLDVGSAYMLLSFGYMLGEKTLCDSVFKILPGSWVEFSHNNRKNKRYYEIGLKEKSADSFNDAVNNIDTLFRQAISREFEKDLEYDYTHCVALSGGLDSRMTCWVAHDMGYTNQLNFTFSQIGYHDQIIPQNIVKDLNHNWIFKSLDNGLWLYNIDTVTKLTGGNVLYYGLSHAISLYSLINFDNLGIIHSGQLGDVIIGSKFNHNTIKNSSLAAGAYSKKLLQKVDYSNYSHYGNTEINWFYARGFNGTNNGLMCEYSFSETASPFMDIDFLEYCLSLPLEYRSNHRIYKKWIIDKYPQAADYPWESIGAKITEPTISIRNQEIPFTQFFPKVIQSLSRKMGLQTSSKGMNPLGLYLKNNSNLVSFFDSYLPFAEYIKDDSLRDDVIDLYKKGNPTEKLQALSLLSAIKLFYCD